MIFLSCVADHICRIAQRVETVVRESVCKWDCGSPKRRPHLHTDAVTERGREGGRFKRNDGETSAVEAS